MQLNLLVLRARRPQALVDFYGRLGVEFVEERHGRGPAHHASRQGSTVLEIYPCAPDGVATTSTRIGFAVANVDETCRRALESDASLVKAPHDSQWGRRAVVQDPEGHMVELVTA